jgi:hypothetical protein
VIWCARGQLCGGVEVAGTYLERGGGTVLDAPSGATFSRCHWDDGAQTLARRGGRKGRGGAGADGA